MSVERTFPVNECSNCEVEITPIDYAECLDTTPSGEDLFGAYMCDCGAIQVVSFRRDAYMAWFNAERQQQYLEFVEAADQAEQRLKSKIGRDVASFRRQLSAIETVEDIPWTT